MAHRPTDGLGWGLFLHRHHVPKDWPRLLESMVPSQHRPEAEAYLRVIAQRMRVVRAYRSSLLPTPARVRQRTDEPPQE